MRVAPAGATCGRLRSVVCGLVDDRDFVERGYRAVDDVAGGPVGVRKADREGCADVESVVGVDAGDRVEVDGEGADEPGPSPECWGSSTTPRTMR